MIEYYSYMFPILISNIFTQSAGQEITYTAVPPVSGLRLGIDRDLDGVLDNDDNCPADANPGQEKDNVFLKILCSAFIYLLWTLFSYRSLVSIGFSSTLNPQIKNQGFLSDRIR